MAGTKRFGAIAVTASLAIAASAAPQAWGDTVCSFDSDSGALQVSADPQTLIKATDDGRISVSDYRQVSPGKPPGYGFVEVVCSVAGPPGTLEVPTVTSVDSIDVHAEILGIRRDALMPGRTLSNEGSSPEIEVAFDGLRLSMVGLPEDETVNFGVDEETGSIAGDLNTSEETGVNSDIDVLAPNLQSLGYSGTGGQNAISGAGGGPVEGALPPNVATGFSGADGSDVLEAGLGPSSLVAGEDAEHNRLVGGPSNDRLTGSLGDDTVIGGLGEDTIAFAEHPGISLDLNLETPQVTGQGTKSLSGIENVESTRAPDVVIGDQGANAIDDQGGADLIVGGPGDDDLFGSTGSDLIIGGLGDDAVYGGWGKDRLRGGSGDDDLNGYFGVDVLRGDSGSDVLRARDVPPFEDEGPFRGDRAIDCGTGRADVALTDEADPESRACERVRERP